MASTDARVFPLKNVAYRVTFPIMDADGDLVTGATGLDSERSLDGATFADCTSEATEIATASGMYFLDLTAAEMNADCTAIIVKTSSVGAKTTALVLYPQEADDIKVAVTHWVATAVATPTVNGVPEVDTTHVGGTVQTAGDIMADTNDIQARLPAALVSGRIDASVGAMAAGTVTAAAVATGAVDADAIAASGGNKIADHVLRRSYATARASGDGDTVSFRSLLGSIARLVNKWSISGTTLTITHEDDATSFATQALTATPAADPITAADTA